MADPGRLRGVVLLAAVAVLVRPAPAQEPDSLRGVLPPDSVEILLDTAPPDSPGGPAGQDPTSPAVDSVVLGLHLTDRGRAELERAIAAGPAVRIGDLSVPRDSVLAGGLLVLDGTVRFAGRTPGGVTVAGGSLYLRPGADIGGDVVVVGGSYYGTGLARVGGETRVLREDRVTVERRGRVVEIRGVPEERRPAVALRGLYGFLPEGYNRVDGLAVRWGFRAAVPPGRRDAVRLTAEAILRTSREDVGWVGRIERELRRERLLLRASAYDRTDTADRWHRTDVEAALATLFLGEDNRFYFDRRGVELFVRGEVRGPLAVELAARNDTYDSVLTQDPFTVAEDDFLPNLPVLEGTIRSVAPALEWRAVDVPREPRVGWRVRLETEGAGGPLGGDADFTSARIDVRRYQPVGSHFLAARVMLGGRLGGSLPEQRRYHLGGAATLPGHEALSVRGDRALLAGLRYRIPLGPLPRIGLFRYGSWITLLADVGDAWESAGRGFDARGSAGVGIAGTGAFREVGVYAVVPWNRAEDGPDVSVFLYLGSFF
ncbi:MAG TPA: BamA/TamA family outer membrane protein [Gemmatimonadota bacterium]